MKFRLIKDLVLNNGLEEEVILKKGDVVLPNDKGEYFFDKLNKSYCIDDLLSKKDMFETIEEIDLVVKEIDENDDDKIGNWRIQLDVKTSRRKLKEIEIFLRETISDML